LIGSSEPAAESMVVVALVERHQERRRRALELEVEAEFDAGVRGGGAGYQAHRDGKSRECRPAGVESAH
jgi:hypothetical protein